jgi:hypothetical protein
MKPPLAEEKDPYVKAEMGVQVQEAVPRCNPLPGQTHNPDLPRAKPQGVKAGRDSRYR